MTPTTSQDEQLAGATVQRPQQLRSLLAADQAVLIAVAALTAWLAWSWRWNADDAFIAFRAVRNVLDGNGPVFNAGERVEVGTSPAWLWLLAGLGALLPVDISWLAVVSGAIGSTLGVTLACFGARALRSAHQPSARTSVLVPVGALVFLALPATWPFLTSGLETGLVFAWLGVVWFGTVRVAAGESDERPAWLLVVIGLGPLVRPDLTLVSGLVGLWLVVAVRSSWPRRMRDIAVAAAVPVAYEVFRMGYFGLLVPNTAVAKESTRAVWDRGWIYLLDLMSPYHLWLPLLLCGVLLARTMWSLRWRPRMVTLVAVTVTAGLLQALFVVRVGGDFMHGRLLLPALFQVLCPVAVVPLSRRPAGSPWQSWTPVVLIGAVLAWCAASAAFLRVDYGGAIGPTGVADERGVYVANSDTTHPVTLADEDGGRPLAWGRQVSRAADAGSTAVYSQLAWEESAGLPRLVPLGTADISTFLVYQAGFLGYASSDGVRVLDFYGLTDPLGSHLEAGPPGRAGHEKTMPIVWFWARYDGDPEQQSPEPSVGVVTARSLAAAREAVQCSSLAELLSATSGPLTPERFWSNLVGAVERTTLRIPTSPFEARAAFCRAS